jgi:F-type H+-transporting ATPase subunit delta
VKITTVIDPELIGGVRIQIADDVIDGSVRARLDDLRQQLAA